MAVPLLLATLAIRAVFTIDRYWIENIAGAEVLAAYVLFAGIANAVMAFLDAGVFVFLYPRIVSAFKEGNALAFKKGMSLLSKQTFIVTIFLCLMAIIIIHPVLSWLERDIYSQHVELLYLLLAAIFIFAISMVPHYGVYAMSKDKYIIGSHLLTLIVFLLVAAGLASVSPVYAVPVALCISLAFMSVCKFSAYFFLKSRLTWVSA
ncbi:lipopolysaccharide biosynthesis protein [Halomonas sp. E19]|uniref:lipopolysaccharide biosynthesis protein n=1 Tax=Halomonas sp. E19 TaxID=3397247 RepID=UPI0040331D6B